MIFHAIFMARFSAVSYSIDILGNFYTHADNNLQLYMHHTANSCTRYGRAPSSSVKSTRRKESEKKKKNAQQIRYFTSYPKKLEGHIHAQTTQARRRESNKFFVTRLRVNLLKRVLTT